MARSFRTEKPGVAAARRLEPEDGGHHPLLRIVERRPRVGDQHPLSARALRNALKEVPGEYLYGLARIELRARQAAAGNPFAVYWPDEKAIILYSLPPQWLWPSGVLNSRLARRMRSFFAVLSPTPGGLQVAWRARWCLALWFYTEVLAHELGHHYRHQYRYRRRAARWSEEEFIAMLHSNRSFGRLRLKLRARRLAQRVSNRGHS